MGRSRELFDAARVDEDATAATMAEVLAATGQLVDPHTAVGIRAGLACRLDPKTPLVTLATAHPAKFPDAVQQATGIRPRFLEQVMAHGVTLSPDLFRPDRNFEA